MNLERKKERKIFESRKKERKKERNMSEFRKKETSKQRIKKCV